MDAVRLINDGYIPTLVTLTNRQDKRKTRRMFLWSKATPSGGFLFVDFSKKDRKRYQKEITEKGSLYLQKTHEVEGAQMIRFVEYKQNPLPVLGIIK
jgi:hypothetical protein